jgi:hypothetical protein
MSASPEYRIWRAIVSLCCDPKVKSFERYGGRGIEVRFKSFEELFAQVGTRPSSDLSATA